MNTGNLIISVFIIQIIFLAEWDVRSLYKPELIGEFFNARAEGYNEYMLGQKCEGNEVYKKFGGFIPKTNQTAVME